MSRLVRRYGRKIKAVIPILAILVAFLPLSASLAMMDVPDIPAPRWHFAPAPSSANITVTATPYIFVPPTLVTTTSPVSSTRQTLDEDNIWVLMLLSIFPAGFAVLGLWRESGVPLMVAAGASLTLAFTWYNIDISSFGLSIALMLICFAIVCASLAYRAIFFGMEAREWA